MTTTKTQLPPTQLPPMRLFTPDECEILVSAGIITEGEQSAVLEGTRLFDVEEYVGMAKAGVLHKEDRIELMDGKIVIMAPIGNHHQFGTDWLTMLLAPLLVGRAIVRVQGSIRLHYRSAPEPDIAVLRMRSFDDIRPYYPNDIDFVVEVADSSLSYDTGAKLARYAAAGIPEVWVANLRIREVTVYADPSGSAYASFDVYRAGDSISPLAFRTIAKSLPRRRFYKH